MASRDAKGTGDARGKRALSLFVGNASFEDVERFAQVMLVDGEAWWVKAPAPYRAYGNGELPKVSCPVVDISGIEAENFAQMARLVGDCVDVVHGVLNRSGLLTGLEALGGRVESTTPQLRAGQAAHEGTRRVKASRLLEVVA